MYKNPQHDTIEFEKAKFYLSKILHEIYPESFPDCHLVSGPDARIEKKKISKFFIYDRLYPNDEHKHYQAMIDAVGGDPFMLDKLGQQAQVSNKDAYTAYQRKLLMRPESRKLLNFLNKTFKVVDLIGNNLALDYANKPIYLDEIDPWRITDYGNLQYNLNYLELVDVIENLKDEAKVRMCKAFLDRIFKLGQAETQRIEKLRGY